MINKRRISILLVALHVFYFSNFAFANQCRSLILKIQDPLSVKLEQLNSLNVIELNSKNKYFNTSIKGNFFSTKKNFDELGITSNNLKWLKLQFQGSVEKGEYAELYIKNLILGLKGFAEAFEANYFSNISDFIETLKNQNKNTILGSDSSNP